MAGSPMLNVNQLITVAKCTAAAVVLPVRLAVMLMRTGTVGVLLSAIRGHTGAICVFNFSD